MSYDNDKKAFDKATQRIIKASAGRMSHREATERLRKAIDRSKKK